MFTHWWSMYHCFGVCVDNDYQTSFTKLWYFKTQLTMEHPALHQLYYPSMECVTIKYVPSTNFHRVISNSAYSGMCMYKISQQKQHWIIAKSQDLLRISQHKRHYHRAHRMISTSSLHILLAFISPNFYRIGKREG